jgi:hypothetical protein
MSNANNFLMGCNCIRLKHCAPIKDMVQNNYGGGFFPSFLSSQLQVYQCKYQKDEMYVCCPNTYGGGQNHYGSSDNYNHHHQPHHNNYNDYQNNWQKYMTKMWNWNANGGYQESAEEQVEENNNNNEGEIDMQPKSFMHIQPYGMPQYVSYPIQVFHPYSFPFTNNANNPHNFIANHEDARTHKNCPPPISQEFTLPPDHTFVTESSVPTTTTTTTTTTAATPTTETPWLPAPLQTKTSLINHVDCGKSSSSRIIGGEDAGEGRFPWVARLSYRNKSSGKISHRCAGSLISNKYVLTAGHCVSNLIDTLEL